MDTYEIQHQVILGPILDILFKKAKNNKEAKNYKYIHVIPNEYCKIKALAFEENKTIKNVIIDRKTITIGDGAFGKCFSLTTITIPNKVKSIEIGTFQFSTSLINITIRFSIELTLAKGQLGLTTHHHSYIMRFKSIYILM